MNYGSGTPAEAAAWVTHSLTTQGDGVALWEVGNENYGCWEVNNWLAQVPENFQGYKPQDFATCPQTTQGNATGTQTLATSSGRCSPPGTCCPGWPPGRGAWTGGT